MHHHTLAALARWLERTVLALAAGALLFRALLYPRMPRPAGAAWGSGDVIDFALGLAVFVLGGACAACGIALTARVEDETARGAAYRPVLTGMTTFVLYYLVHPYVPALT